MRGFTWGGHLAVFLWAAWGLALQGFAAAAGLGPWTPELGTVLLLGLERRLEGREVLGAALCVALARIAFSADPPPAVVLGYLVAVSLPRALRRGLEIDGPLATGLLGALLGAGLTAFWVVVALPSAGLPSGFGPLALVPGALTTGAIALLASERVVWLPGLGGLRRRRV